MYETLAVRILRRALGLATQKIENQDTLIATLKLQIANQDELIETFKVYRGVAQNRMAQQDTLIAALELEKAAHEALIATQGFMLNLYRG